METNYQIMHDIVIIQDEYSLTLLILSDNLFILLTACPNFGNSLTNTYLKLENKAIFFAFKFLSINLKSDDII